ncbi:hypothetical protein V8E53_009302, partial [Lactarius tabidus]
SAPPVGSPYPYPFGHIRRESTSSMRSSPSHQPVPLPFLSRGNHGLRRREHSQDLRRRAKVRLPPRVENTQPRDTSPELSSGEETAGEFKAGEHSSDPQRYAPRPAQWDESADDEDVGGMEGVADDLLQLEFHTDYVGNPEKRRRRWKLRWEALRRGFHALDRETDTTLVLLAAPSQTGKLRSVASRAIRRDSSLHESTDIACIRSAFAELAARRRASRG